MREQLKSLAKDLGFDSNIIGKSVESRHSNKDFYHLWLCELQKYLRENYNVHFVIKPFHDSIENKTTYVADPIYLTTGRTDKTERRDSYNEALEEGLIKGINLIKQ